MVYSIVQQKFNYLQHDLYFLSGNLFTFKVENIPVSLTLKRSISIGRAYEPYDGKDLIVKIEYSK